MLASCLCLQAAFVGHRLLGWDADESGTGPCHSAASAKGDQGSHAITVAPGKASSSVIVGTCAAIASIVKPWPSSNWQKRYRLGKLPRPSSAGSSSLPVGSRAGWRTRNPRQRRAQQHERPVRRVHRGNGGWWPRVSPQKERGDHGELRPRVQRSAVRVQHYIT